METIPFHRPYKTGEELLYLKKALSQKHLGGNGPYTKECQDFFNKRYLLKQSYLTSSCTDALEMAALLTEVGPGDEVIIPSYTSPSTANAFLLRGADIVFVDSSEDHPNMDIGQLSKKITPRTKVIVVVHYGGHPCQMDLVMELAKINNIFVVEDAAQAVESSYKGQQLGTIGDLGTFSFHETKNISSGEGGLLLVNKKDLIKRAELIWQMGTNKLAFQRGEVKHYEWKDLGSSYFPSDIVASLLMCQLDHIDKIMEKRKRIWQFYDENLKPNIYFKKHFHPGNFHNYFILFKKFQMRESIQLKLREQGIQTATHFVPLHTKAKKDICPNALNFSKNLLRLPFYGDLGEKEQEFIVHKINELC